MPPFGETRVSETGELLLKSPAVFKGYYADDKATARVLSADGWFSTGDLGTIDAAGDVRITGRKSRVLVFDSGKKVSPEELESKLLQLACIEEVFVCAETSSRVITAEVFSHSPSAEVERAVDTLNRKLPVYMRIRRVRFRDTPFPRTASGKIIVGK
jgi:long-chain acyl-CoA synthetase